VDWHKLSCGPPPGKHFQVQNFSFKTMEGNAEIILVGIILTDWFWHLKQCSAYSSEHDYLCSNKEYVKSTGTAVIHMHPWTTNGLEQLVPDK